MNRKLVALSIVAAVALGTRAAADPFTVGGDSRVDSADFRITTFAHGLDFPMGLQELLDGSILVGNSVAPGNLFGSSDGELLRFEDVDRDGVSDGPGTVLFSGLPGLVSSLRLAGELVFVASSKPGAQRISILRRGASVSDSYSLEGFINLVYPSGGWHHASFTTAVRKTGPGQFQLFFNIGSRSNDQATTETVILTGLVDGVARGDSIYRVTVEDADPTLTVSGLEQIATGLRNAWGMAFDPSTGDLYFQDNGIDGVINAAEPESADELNRIAEADLGGAIEDFGFPDHYVEYRTGNIIGAGALLPEIAFQPLPAPTGAESEGPAEIAFAPRGFPTGLNHGLFVGFHGQFHQAGVANQENPLVYVDLASGEYFHFVANTEPVVGHLNSLVATADSLFVADLASAGSLSTSGTGVIYQIRANPPSLPILAPAAILSLISLLLVLAVSGFARIT